MIDRYPWHIAASALLAIVAAASGCSQSANATQKPGPHPGPLPDAGLLPDPGPLPDAGLPPDVVAFCQGYGKAACAAADSCPEAVDLWPDACVYASTTTCMSEMSAIAGAFTSGRVVLDPTAVATCLAGSKIDPCHEFVPGCINVLRGTVPMGGTCYAPNFGSARLNECADGFCTATQWSCPGQCAPYRMAGEACPVNNVDACVSTAYCGSPNCVAYIQASGPCGGLTDQCAPPLACGPEGADGGLVCVVPRAEGQPCTEDGECVNESCQTGTCRPGHLGEPCSDGHTCDPGLACTGGFSGCQQPIALDGQCDPNYGGCAAGLICETKEAVPSRGELGVCHKLRTPTAGEPCFNGQCAPGFWCDDSTASPGTCRIPSAAGGPCNGAYGSCEAGLVCNGAARCQVPSVAGGVCSANAPETCAPGYACGPQNLCEPTVGPGGSCDTDAVCPLQYYCKGTCLRQKLSGAPCNGMSDDCGGNVVCDPAAGVCSGNCADPL